MSWKDGFKAALIEVDPTKLLTLIHDTEAAITLRSESLPKVSDQEIQEMSDATRTLHLLKNHTQTGSV